MKAAGWLPFLFGYYHGYIGDFVAGVFYLICSFHCRGGFHFLLVQKTKQKSTPLKKEGMARLGLYKAEILLKPTINEVDFRYHVFTFLIPNLALTSLLSPWGLNYPHL